VALDCIDPGAVQDWELEACANGEASSYVVEHLKHCPACRARLAEYVAVERRLRQALYRFDCPSLDLLRDYHWGYLPAGEHHQVKAHLDACPHCQAELARLAEFVAAERAEPSSALLARAREMAAQVRLVVARFISPSPRLVPLLRGETREVLLFDAEGITLSVNLEQDDAGTYTLFGQALSPEPVLPLGGYARLTAREQGAVPVQASLDANGGFALTNLRPGTYQLVVCLPDRRIVVPTLALKAE